MEKDSLVAILGHLNDIPHVLSGTPIQTCTVNVLISILKPFIIPCTSLYCNCFSLLSKTVDPKQPCILKFFKKSTSSSMTDETVAEQSASSEGMIEGDPYIMWILLQLKIQHYLANTSVEGMLEDTHQNTGSDSIDICDDSGEETDETSDMTECIADCCSLTHDNPNQPTDKTVLVKTKKFQGNGKFRQGRCVQSCWLQKYKWLSLCTTRKTLFCVACVTAVQCILLTFSKNTEPSFTTMGFCNWRKAWQCFLKHEKSSSHHEAILKVNSTEDISAYLNAVYRENLKTRWTGLIKQLSSLRYLLRQELAIGGHKDVNSNLYQLLCLRCEDDHQ